MNNQSQVKSVLIIAAEPSGDELGAEFIAKLMDIAPDVEIKGAGLHRMANLGIKSDISLDGLAILGLVEAVGAWRKVVEAAEKIGDLAEGFKPDVAILIDSWGFSLRAARAIKKKSPSTRLIKMVGPQVWATRAGRAKTLAKLFDEIWCIHEFELPFYNGLGIDAYVIGNPALSRAVIGDGIAFKDRHNIANKRIVGILPGSRSKEIKNVAETFIESANKLTIDNEELVFITVAANSVRNLIEPLKAMANFNWIIVDEDEKADAFAAMEMALACSGTVTTELAIAKVPMVVGYRLDQLTYFIAKNFLLKSKYVCLLNVALGEEVVPELLQEDLNTSNVCQIIQNLLDDEPSRIMQIERQNSALKQMGLGAGDTASRAVDLLMK